MTAISSVSKGTETGQIANDMLNTPEIYEEVEYWMAQAKPLLFVNRAVFAVQIRSAAQDAYSQIEAMAIRGEPANVINDKITQLRNEMRESSRAFLENNREYMLNKKTLEQGFRTMATKIQESGKELNFSSFTPSPNKPLPARDPFLKWEYANSNDLLEPNAVMRKLKSAAKTVCSMNETTQQLCGAIGGVFQNTHRKPYAMQNFYQFPPKEELLKCLVTPNSPIHESQVAMAAVFGDKKVSHERLAFQVAVFLNEDQSRRSLPQREQESSCMKARGVQYLLDLMSCSAEEEIKP